MANFGLSFPVIAKLNEDTEKYSDVFKCGSAINTSVTPNYNEAALFADNMQKEQVSEFKNAAVELGVDELPIKAAELFFGHKIEEDGTETSNVNDSGFSVGYGFITSAVISGVKKYKACLLLKVKFKENAENYKTKGDNIEFNTPAVSGIATANSHGEWRKKSPYLESENACYTWILQKLGVAESDISGTE